MSPSWLQISLKAPPPALDTISNFLIERGPPGVVLEGNRVRAFFPHAARRRALKRDIRCFLKEISEIYPGTGGQSLRWSVLKDKNWNSSWRKFFSPQKVGKGLWITPPRFSRRKVITIEPGMAFGTGTHSTTRGCLEFLEKATELGVRAIVPFFSLYTVPKFGPAKTEAREMRWKKIALSAAKQSGRTRIPEISDPGTFEDLVRRPDSYDLKLIFWERAQPQPLSVLKEQYPHLRSILLMIGPEGGFAPDEVALALSRGFRAVSLGKRILRTETAALAVLSLVQFLWGDLGGRD